MYLDPIKVNFDYQLEPDYHPLAREYQFYYYEGLPAAIRSFYEKVTRFDWKYIRDSFADLSDTIKDFGKWRLLVKNNNCGFIPLTKRMKTIDPDAQSNEISPEKYLRTPPWLSKSSRRKCYRVIQKINRLLVEFCELGNFYMWELNYFDLRNSVKILENTYKKEAPIDYRPADLPPTYGLNSWDPGYQPDPLYQPRK